MDEYGIPGLGTYAAPGWYGDNSPESYTPPASREAAAMPTSQSQVPGTSGAPSYTPSATPGGVSSGSPGGTAAGPPPTGAPSNPWGDFAGLLGLNAPKTAANAMKPGQGMRIAQLGMRMLGPPASPLRSGQPAPQLSPQGQNPQVAQFQQMFGVDYQTALAMMSLMHPGGTAMTPSQQTQTTFGGSAFMPPVTPETPLLPSSQMATPSSPYGSAQRVPIGRPLPPLGAGAFPSATQLQPISSQTLFGLPQMAEGGRPTGPTIVGERGPEIFVPDMPGSIVPMQRTMPYEAILRAMQQGAGIQRRRFGYGDY